MKKAIIVFGSLGLISYCGICLALYIFQRSLIYFPQPRSLGPTESAIVLNSGKEQIVISTRPLASSKAVIYFPGNAEDPSSQLAQFAKAFPDRAVFLMHYRGYGSSTGNPQQEGLFQDAMALYDLVSKSHPDVVVIGRSLGSGIATFLASQKKVERLVLVTPYASVLGVAEKRFSWLPIQFLLKDRFESTQYAPQIQANTVVLIAQSDSVIPRWSTDELVRALPKNLVSISVLDGTNHNSIAQHPNYFRQMKANN
jgi:uncharacterized protein